MNQIYEIFLIYLALYSFPTNVIMLTVKVQLLFLFIVAITANVALWDL